MTRTAFGRGHRRWRFHRHSIARRPKRRWKSDRKTGSNGAIDANHSQCSEHEAEASLFAGHRGTGRAACSHRVDLQFCVADVCLKAFSAAEFCLMTQSTPAWIVLAHLLRPQGRKGEVLAELFTDFPERFEEQRRVFLAAPGFERRSRRGALGGGGGVLAARGKERGARRAAVCRHRHDLGC